MTGSGTFGAVGAIPGEIVLCHIALYQAKETTNLLSSMQQVGRSMHVVLLLILIPNPSNCGWNGLLHVGDTN